MKFIFLILSILSTSISYAITAEDYVTDTINESLDLLMDYQDSDKSKSIQTLIRENFLPKIDVQKASKIVFSKHWKKLSLDEQGIASKYIVNKVLNDYSGLIHRYKQEERVVVKILPKSKYKKNLAIVYTSLLVGSSSKIPVAFKLIKGDNWKVYDVVLFGTSFMNTYKSSINSKVRRKGLVKMVESLAIN